MATEPSEAEFLAGYLARVRQARTDRELMPEQMAKALGISVHRYRKYETRSPLPLHLLERFSLITGKDIAWLVTGATAKRLRAVSDSSAKSA